MKFFAKLVLTCAVVFIIICSFIVNWKENGLFHRERLPFHPQQQIHTRVNDSEINNENATTFQTMHSSKKTYFFNCNNIKNIELKEKLGNGISKQGYLGLYQGKQVVVKMSKLSMPEVKECLDELNAKNVDRIYRKQCKDFANGKIMKEILLLQLLDHPNLVKIIGYCIRSTEITDSGLDQHGVVSVAEFGQKLTVNYLKGLPFQERLRHAQEVAELVLYFDNSPIGSIAVPDFKLRHFLMLDNHIKMIDLDMITARPEYCGNNHSCDLKTICNMTIHECENYNTIFNMNKYAIVFGRPFFSRETYPSQLDSRISILNNKLLNLTISAQELIYELQELRNIEHVPAGNTG